MQTKPPFLLSTFILFFQLNSYAQLFGDQDDSKAGWFSFGARSTISSFDHDGSGIGAGGQYRIQLSNSVNTDWYADYIAINVGNKVRSEYYHIGWSVLFYPFNQLRGATLFQPYILAGHCFDYNKKTAIGQPANSKSRWGSAVQAGLGTHLNLSERFDISLTSQYMIHLTKELDADIDGDKVFISSKSNSSLEGHMLTTISINYKIFRLWKN